MGSNFSVSMSVYGGDDSNCFECALNSIINQTLKPNEIVLVIDGQIPKQIEDVISNHVEELRYSSIDFRVIKLDINKGHGEARRIGLENCSFPLVAIMDADDISDITRFEKQIKCFEKDASLSVVGSNIVEFIGSDDVLDTSNIVGYRIVPENDVDIKEYMKKRCPMNQVTVMINKDDVQSVGGYLDWFCEEDYYLWARLALANKRFKNIPENLVKVRVGKEMYRRRGGIRYFVSELKFQLYLYHSMIIDIQTLISNVIIRLVVQLLMPNSVRAVFFKLFARS